MTSKMDSTTPKTPNLIYHILLKDSFIFLMKYRPLLPKYFLLGRKAINIKS